MNGVLVKTLGALALCLLASASWAQGRVTLNFVNAEIDTVVRAMGQITGKNFLLDPRVKGTISISSVSPVSADLAYQILISSLRMQGFTAVEGKGVVKILPEADAKQHYSQTYGKVVKSGGDQVVTQVYPLQHATAAQLVTVLRPLIAPNNAVSAYPGSNTLVITDYAENLKRLTQIIEAIDKPNDAEFNVIKVKHLSAVELAQQLARLFADPSAAPAGQAGAGGNALLIAADGRSNSLLVRTDNQGKLETLRAMVAQLDTPAAGMTNLQVVHLRNADATKLAETLRQLAAGEARANASVVTAAGAAAAVGNERRQRRHHPRRCRQQLAGDQRAGPSLQQPARGHRQTGRATRPGVRRSVDRRSDQRQGGRTGHPVAGAAVAEHRRFRAGRRHQFWFRRQQSAGAVRFHRGRHADAAGQGPESGAGADGQAQRQGNLQPDRAGAAAGSGQRRQHPVDAESADHG
jgi:hypothetical protein